MTLAVITPSYRNDWPLFVDLHQSVLRNTPESVKHYVIVPNADVQLFSQAAGPRCIIIPEETLYPRHYRPAPAANRILHLLPRIPLSARVAALNIKRPFHPVRGWVMQQALKMEACRRIAADITLMLDSDVVLIRPVTQATLSNEGRPRLYRLPGAVGVHLPQHMQWHVVSRKLLGLPPPDLPAPDYVSSFTVWDPYILRALLARIELVTSEHWMDAVTAQRNFSEWTIYGVFADELMKDRIGSAAESSLCHSYWGVIPLNAASAEEFVAGTGQNDVAILIQSKSRTPIAVRRAALSSFRGETYHALASEPGWGGEPDSRAGTAELHPGDRNVGMARRPGNPD
jgi:Family of unknown function (DUF6492)